MLGMYSGELIPFDARVRLVVNVATSVPVADPVRNVIVGTVGAPPVLIRTVMPVSVTPVRG